MMSRTKRSAARPISFAARRSSRLAALLLVVAALAAGCTKVPLFAPTGSSITLSANRTTAPLNTALTITAVVQEAAGTPAQNGTLVTFSSNLGSFDPTEARTNGGRVSVTFNTGTQSGTATVVATSGAAKTASTGDSTLKIVIGSAAAKTIQISASATTVRPGGGTVDVIANVVDEAGNGLAGIPVIFSTTAGTLGATQVNTSDAGEARTTLTTNKDATVTATSGSATAAKVDIKVGAPPTGSVAVSSSTITAGQSVVITVTAGTSAAPATLATTLNFGDGTTQNLGTVTGSTAVTHTYNTAGTYTITANFTDSNGDTTNAATSVAVGQRVVQSVTLGAPSPTSPTTSAPLSFTVTVGTTAGALPVSNVRVDFGDGSAIDLGAVTGDTSVSHTYTTAATYQIKATLTDTGGFTSTATRFVTVTAPTPFAVTLATSPASVTTITPVVFTATPTLPTGTRATQYSWDFGDGSTATTTANVTTHTYSTAGTYVATVTVTASDGSTGTASVAVTVTAG